MLLLLAAGALLPALSPGCAAPYQLSTKAPMVHVALYKLKPGAPATATEDFLRDARRLLVPIPVIQGIWMGRPAPTGSALRPFVIEDYDIGLAVMVEDSRALQAFLEDPRHRDFAIKYEPLTDARVIEFSPRGAGPVP
jgi:hypothetical protein